MSITENDIQNVLSIGAAQTLFSQIRNNNELKKLLAETVLNAENMVGGSDDYHNLAVEYSREDDYLTAFSILEKGMAQYKFNIDLLADAVYYGSNAGQYQKCEEYAEILKDRPRALWNWRAFTFLIDYYLEKADWTESISEMLENTNVALALAQDYQAYLPEEEKGYNAEYKVRMVRKCFFREYKLETKDEEVRNKYEQQEKEERELAEAALRRAIDAKSFPAVQCCVKYADSLFESCRYEEVIPICEQAFAYTEVQPSANLGYLLYLRALAMDAVVHQGKKYDEVHVNEVYQAYEVAKRANSDRLSYLKTISTRMNLLAGLTGFEPAKTKLSPDDCRTDDNLMSLLSRLTGNE